MIKKLLNLIQTLGTKGRIFYKNNSTLLTVILCLLIIVEGSIIWFYPHLILKSTIIIACLALLVLVWRNFKVVMKFAVSLGLTIVLAAYATISGTLVSHTPLNGVLILLFWAISVTESYYLVTVRSRWSASLIVSVLCFITTIILLDAHPVWTTITGIVVSLVGTFIILKFENIIIRWKGLKPLENQRFDEVTGSMVNVWPEIRFTTRRLRKNVNVGIYSGTNCPTFVIIPLSLDESIKKGFMGGLTYHGFNVGKSITYYVKIVESWGLKQAPIVVFWDVKGWNNSSKDESKIISVPMVDSNNPAYVGIISGTSNFKSDITNIGKTFKVYK